MAKISDLTLLYISASQMPQRWMEFQLATLSEAAYEAPIVGVSRNPSHVGDVNLLDEEPQSYWNIYMQMLRAARFAKTEFVAMVEDDVLYSREHFTEFRPKSDEVSYNRSRWSLFTWDPMYCLRQRVSNCSLIAPRALLIEALEERKRVWPDEPPPNKITGEVGRPIIDKRLRVTPRKAAEWYSEVPVIQLNHQSGSDEFATRKWKKHGQLKAYDIPFWGKAETIAKEYDETA